MRVIHRGRFLPVGTDTWLIMYGCPQAPVLDLSLVELWQKYEKIFNYRMVNCYNKWCIWG